MLVRQIYRQTCITLSIESCLLGRTTDVRYVCIRLCCFKCIVHSCKREWCRHNERARHMKAWKRVKLPLSDVIFRSWAPQTRERGQERGSHIHLVSSSPLLLRHLPALSSHPSTSLPWHFSLFFSCSLWQLLSSIVFHRAFSSGSLAAPTRQAHSHSVSTNHYFFSSFLKSRNQMLKKDWLGCVVWYRCFCSNTVTVYCQ